MNKIEQLKKRHEGYKAACEAIRLTKPKTLVVKIEEKFGHIQFDPEDNYVQLHIEGKGYIKIGIEAIPHLAKALQDLMEEETDVS
jgi:hypothetical protein